jgi:hypothetical protein
MLLRTVLSEGGTSLVGLGGETVVARALPAGEDDRHGRGESARLDKLNEETGWRPLGELDQEMG